MFCLLLIYLCKFLQNKSKKRDCCDKLIVIENVNIANIVF
jgi:hypothetical protein